VDRNVAPARFQAALLSLKDAEIRPEVRLTEVPAPKRVAPYAVAIDGALFLNDSSGTGKMYSGKHPRPAMRALSDDDEEIPACEGTFVVLFDPQGQTNWGGQFRVVTYLQARVDQIEAKDPMLAEVAWSWVTDAIGHHPVTHLSGTVTVQSITSFGEIEPDYADSAERSLLQVRASWSPTSEQVGPHLAMWTDMLAAAGGLERLPSEVTFLDSHRAAAHGRS